MTNQFFAVSGYQKTVGTAALLAVIALCISGCSKPNEAELNKVTAPGANAQPATNAAPQQKTAQPAAAPADDAVK